MKESDIPITAKSNLCLGGSGIYKLLCHTFDGIPMVLNPDTGDASFGVLYNNMASVIGKSRSLQLASKKMRMAGAGGVLESQYYRCDQYVRFQLVMFQPLYLRCLC